MATIIISDLSQELQDNSLLSELSPEEIAAISGGGLFGRIIGAIVGVGGVVGFFTGGLNSRLK
jgi:LytS/YehU family sensor histidine kinase